MSSPSPHGQVRAAFAAIMIAMMLLCAAAPALAHRDAAAWLDEGAIDEGVYVSIAHPRIIRDPAPFEVSIVLANLEAEGDVVINEVRWALADAPAIIVRPAGRSLADRRAAFRQ